MEKSNWQDEAIEKSGVKVPEWELEPTGAEQKETMEAAVETEPSVAEKRLEELAAEVKEIPAENPEQKAAQVETMRAEIAEMAKPEQKPLKTEVVAVTKEVNMRNVDFHVPSVIDGAGNRVNNDYAAERNYIKEASGGLIEYMPNNKGENGYGFEGKGDIPPEKLEKLKTNLETAENAKSKEAFDYVKVPNKAFGSNWTKNFRLNDGKAFGLALDAKRFHNKDVRDNIKFGTAAASVAGTVGGIAIAGAGAGAAGMAMVSLMGGVPLVIGGLGWLGKKLYDSYKEKKAVKNFQTASVAQNMRHSLTPRKLSTEEIAELF